MKRLAFTCLILLLLAGCGSAPQLTPVPTEARVVSTPLPPGTVTASAVVVPAQEAHLAFLVPGTVKEVDFAEGDPVATGQTVAIISSPDLEYAVLQAQEAARAAEFRYQYWIPARLDRPPERRQLAEQQFIAVQRSADTALAALQQTILRAPFDGVVTGLDTAVGEFVQPGQAVVTLADLDHLQIETTDLSERDIPSVQPGQTAQVTVEALGGTFPGKVTAIAPRAETLGGDVIYRVTIVLDSIPDGLRWGMTAEVNIDTQK